MAEPGETRSGAGAVFVAGVADGERPLLLRSLDYPCTARLRLRRLLACLRGRRHSYPEVFLTAKETMRVVFHVRELMGMVYNGLWREAASYVHSFAPFATSSHEARVFLMMLRILSVLHDFAFGKMLAPAALWRWLLLIHKTPVLAEKYPCFAALIAAVLHLRPQDARGLLDWELVRDKAAMMA